MIPDVAWIGVALTMLGLVWRSSSEVARVRSALERLEKDLKRLETMGDTVARIPVIETRMTMTEAAIVRLVAEVQEVSEHVAAIEAVQGRRKREEY